jgi:hypothetical protein
MFKRHPFITLFFLASVIFLAHYAYVGNGVWGDGRYYYVFTRSWVLDHDIDFQNERLVNPFYFDFTPTPIGRAGNKYSIGTSIMWLPAFLVAHAISLIGAGFGLPLIPDGYGHVYRIAIGLENIALLSAALYCMYRAVKHLFPQAPALLAVLTIGLGTHLVYYFALDPITSHAPSVFISSLIMFVLTLKPLALRPKLLAITLGFLTGLLGMIRPHDLIFALPIFLWFLGRKTSVKSKLLDSLLYALSSLLGFIPQLLSQWLLYGTLKSPYFLLGEGFNFLNSHPIAILFSSRNGLFLYSPLWFIGVIGLIQSSVSQPIARLGLSLLVLQTLILGSWSGWWGGESFGGRMFLSLTPFIALGLAAIYQTLSTKIQRTATLSAVSFTLVLAFHYLLTH